jgi:hypothetical protein
MRAQAQDEQSVAPWLPPTLSNDVTGNLMRSPEGRTARLTVISVLLGAMIGTIIATLPPSPVAFATTVLTGDHLLIDLQVLAVLFVVLDFWIEFSWSVILNLAPFDFFGNFLLFVTAMVIFAWILSLSDFRAWVIWGGGIVGMAFVNGSINRFIRESASLGGDWRFWWGRRWPPCTWDAPCMGCSPPRQPSRSRRCSGLRWFWRRWL